MRTAYAYGILRILNKFIAQVSKLSQSSSYRLAGSQELSKLENTMAYTTIRTQVLKPANVEAAKRGFLKTLCDYVAKNGDVPTSKLVKRFAGKTDGSKVVSTERVVRYAYYAVQHGLLTAH
jgi:hypothetical protein